MCAYVRRKQVKPSMPSAEWIAAFFDEVPYHQLQDLPEDILKGDQAASAMLRQRNAPYVDCPDSCEAHTRTGLKT